MEAVPWLTPRAFSRRASASCPAAVRSTVRIRDWKEVYEEQPVDRAAAAGRPLHGLRHPVLPQRLPARQPHPRVERPRLAGRLAPGASSGCTRRTTSRSSPAGSARRRASRRACSASTSPPVTIKQVEVRIIDQAFDNGSVTPAAARAALRQDRRRRRLRPGRARRRPAADPRRPHRRRLRARRRIGGLLRYGIPEFKMEKSVLDRRLAQMKAEGTRFRTGVEVGATSPARTCASATTPSSSRSAPPCRATCRCPGRELDGIHQAMEYLPPANRVALGQSVEGQVTAEGKHVVVIGGGDTGADCIGTAHRQGAASVTQLEIMPQPAGRAGRAPAVADLPDDLPRRLRARGGRRAGLRRVHRASSSATSDGRVRRAAPRRGRAGRGRLRRRSRAREREIPAQLVLLAMGFLGPSQELLDQLGVELDERSNVARDDDFMTNVPGVFVAGDAGRGQSLIVWAIAEGRAAAHGVDAWLTGKPSRLPRPIEPTDRPLDCPDDAGRPSRRVRDCGPGHRVEAVPRDRVAAMRRAKIVCTLGPATSSAEKLRALVHAGHGRRPAQPQPRRPRRPRAGLPATCGRRATSPAARSASSSTCRAPRSAPAASPTGPIDLVPGATVHHHHA